MTNLISQLRDLRTDRDHEDGFTLIELMIVVVIIGILAAIAIPIFMNQQKAAINAGVKSDVRNTTTNVATALSKNPTATDVSTIGATPIESDENTTTTVTGAWDAYTVRAVNSSTEGCVEYVSTTGKTQDCDYASNAPAGPGTGEEGPTGPQEVFGTFAIPSPTGGSIGVGYRANHDGEPGSQWQCFSAGGFTPEGQQWDFYGTAATSAECEATYLAVNGS